MRVIQEDQIAKKIYLVLKYVLSLHQLADHLPIQVVLMLKIYFQVFHKEFQEQGVALTSPLFFLRLFVFIGSSPTSGGFANTLRIEHR